jgi:hypothetical protein
MRAASRGRSSLLRGAIIVIGLLTAALAVWWSAAEIWEDPAIAAEIGIIRGSLWLKAALAPSVVGSGGDARPALERAARFSPANPEIWFDLALASERFDWLDRETAAALKMSYYTGFNSPALVAPRLLLLVRTDSSRDPELGDIMRRQIRLIVRRAPALDPTIAQAYATASAANRQIIEEQLRESAPDLVPTLRDK